MRGRNSWVVIALLSVPVSSSQSEEADRRYPDPIDMRVTQLADDAAIQYDYDIVYVRVPRRGDDVRSQWAEISHPVSVDPGGDLMLLHPDGSEEVLVAGGDGSVIDPMVSFDGQWVYYSLIHDLKVTRGGKFPKAGADIFKIHLPSRRIVRLTEQRFTPNTGAADWSDDYVTPQRDKTWLDYGVFHTGPCPLTGGRLVFTSNRDGFRPPQHPGPTLQLFVMDDDGKNVECIGHMNIAMALHPLVLTDGRIVFSSLESQALRRDLLWGLWSVHPDGSNFAPIVSAFDSANAFHFQTQLSDGTIVAEQYYNQNNSGFGSYFRFPADVPAGYAAFGSALPTDPRNRPLRVGRHYNSKPKLYRLPFSPFGIASLTRFANNGEGAADPSVLGKPTSARVGKFTHPSAAPDNHLLTVYTPGPANHQQGLKKPAIDGGLYMIKGGKPIDAPADMRLIKNDPRYNEQWPRAVVPYRRIYGVDEPRAIPPVANDGRLPEYLGKGTPSVRLSAGTPLALVGSSSLYKRETYPGGGVPEGQVTATFVAKRDRNGYQGLDPFNTAENGASPNWSSQGADAGRYENDQIHAIRILAMEPTTDRHRGPQSGRLFFSHAQERLRILGEIPVRKFRKDGTQPTDSDGNPDTSFLARIPGDTAFTFQTLDVDGMVLNMSQTWHQLRPGEVRTDCGGCHAHSQQPTPFEQSYLAWASRNGLSHGFDLAEQTPLLTNRAGDELGRQVDTEGVGGVRFANESVVNVEYFRDIQPIFRRSCIACHSSRDGQDPAGNLNLDADHESVRVPGVGGLPGSYYRLAADAQAQFGHKPVIHNGTWRQTNASRYVRKFQSRRSLLVWKTHGRRLDGWHNDDFPTARVPGDADTLELAGAAVPNTRHARDRSDLDYRGSVMPPVEAVLKGRAAPLSDEDRRTIVRWIDLGCPIDLDPASRTGRNGFGWMGDDKRPTLTVSHPAPGENASLKRFVIGMHDYYTGLQPGSLRVKASFEVNGKAAGENLAQDFRQIEDGVFELRLDPGPDELTEATLEVSVSDRQGNLALIERTFSLARPQP